MFWPTWCTLGKVRLLQIVKKIEMISSKNYRIHTCLLVEIEHKIIFRHKYQIYAFLANLVYTVQANRKELSKMDPKFIIGDVKTLQMHLSWLK